jgi:hypothetical protein
MPRPATNRAVADEIARSYEKFDRQELINILSYLTKVYVVDGTMPFNLPGAGGGPGGQLADVAGAEKDFDFVKLVDQVKRRLPHLPELAAFQIEDGKVTLRAGNQKIVFGERITSEFVPTSAPSPAAPAPQKGAAPAIAAAAKAAGGAKKAEEKQPNLSDTQQEALNDIVTRFKNLELD